MERAYKFRAYPTKEQKQKIVQMFGAKRFVYNMMLADQELAYSLGKKGVSYVDMAHELVKEKNQTEWLKEADKWALQNACKDLEQAYKNFFVKRAEYPKFKKKHDTQSYRTTNSNNNIEYKDGKIKLPKLKWLKLKGYSEIKGRILNATISMDRCGDFYVSVVCTDIEQPKFERTDKYVGVDLGIKDIAITSDGAKYKNNKYLGKSERRIVWYQRKLSRKTKGSKNRIKAMRKLAVATRKVARQRLDSIHKMTTELVKHYDVICIEDLQTKNMLKNHKLAKAITDVAWREIRRQLEYKSKWYGKELVVIDRFYASSQICSECGYKNKDVKDLSIREWECPHCHAYHDRDVNASKNILAEGLRMLKVA